MRRGNRCRGFIGILFSVHCIPGGIPENRTRREGAGAGSVQKLPGKGNRLKVGVAGECFGADGADLLGDVQFGECVVEKCAIGDGGGLRGDVYRCQASVGESQGGYGG